MYFPVNFAKFLRTPYLQNTTWMTASDFICDVFFIFSIIKNFRHEKRRFVRKKSTSGKPALHFESDLPSFSTLYILSKKEWPCRNRGLPYSNLSLVIFRLSVFLFYIHKFRMKNLFRQNFSSLHTQITEAVTERCCSKIAVPKI